jgi:hypothetical protein
MPEITELGLRAARPAACYSPAQRKPAMPNHRVKFLATALLLAAVSLAPAPAMAQRETEYERQTREDQQATRDRLDQAARIAKMHEENSAQYERERQKAAGQVKSGAEIRFRGVRQKWSVNAWDISALPAHECVALVQKGDLTPFNFWGFRVRNGQDVQLFFGSIADARPQTVQVVFNDAPPISYAASVEPFQEWNAYVVPIKLEDLWAFQDELFFDVYAGATKVTWGGTKVMGKVAEALEKCDNWETAH